MDALVSLKNIRKTYGDRSIFNNINCDFFASSIYLILGRNGSGKTTLLKLVAGLAHPDAGEIRIKDNLKVGFLGHDTFLYPGLTVMENLKFWSRIGGRRADESTILEILERAGLESRRDDLAKSLSRGMSQRLNFARLALQDPNLWLLDEPFSGLDEQSQIFMRDELRRIKSRGACVALVSHNPNEDGSLADFVLKIEDRAIRNLGRAKDGASGH